MTLSRISWPMRCCTSFHGSVFPAERAGAVSTNHAWRTRARERARAPAFIRTWREVLRLNAGLLLAVVCDGVGRGDVGGKEDLASVVDHGDAAVTDMSGRTAKVKGRRGARTRSWGCRLRGRSRRWWWKGQRTCLEKAWGTCETWNWGCAETEMADGLHLWIFWRIYGKLGHAGPGGRTRTTRSG